MPVANPHDRPPRAPKQLADESQKEEGKKQDTTVQLLEITNVMPIVSLLLSIFIAGFIGGGGGGNSAILHDEGRLFIHFPFFVSSVLPIGAHRT